MLTSFPLITNFVSDNLSECKTFYTEKLGLLVENYQEDSFLMLRAGENTKLFIYYKKNLLPSENTGASFLVTNLEDLVTRLTKNGITFEHYDDPNGPQTNEKGIAERNGEKAAWLKDPSGNIISLYEGSMKG